MAMKLTYCDRPYDTLQGADGLAIVTEWQEFRNPNFALMSRLLREPVVFDGRNLYDPVQMAEAGFQLLFDWAPDHGAGGAGKALGRIVLESSFPGSAWERTSARLCLAEAPQTSCHWDWPAASECTQILPEGMTPNCGQRGRASRKCVPRQSLGTSVTLIP